MNWMADRSLRQKLMFISIAPALIALALVLVGNSIVNRQAYQGMVEDELLSTARMLAFNSTALLEFNEKLAGIRLLEATSIYPDIDYACIYDRNGALFSEYHRDPGITSHEAPPVQDTGVVFDGSGASLYHPIHLDGERLGTIYLHSTMSGYYDQIRQHSILILALLVASGLIALLLAMPIQRLIYNPVTQLAGAARTISRTNDYSLRVIKQGQDELGELVDEFNSMLRRIQQQNTALRKEIIVREGTEQQLMAANEELQFEIGQRVQAEEQLGVLIENLEAKNEELQDFAYVVSHDLKAPLRGISSLATWLLKDYSDRLDDKGIKYLEQLKARTRRMHTFIEGILQYSRLGRTPMNEQQLDTRDLVAQVLDTLAPPPEIDVEIADTLPEIVFDKLLLLQVFQNLIGNAIQHMGSPSGRITVGCRHTGRAWEFSVADNGVGIEKKHHERIFRIFQSLHARDENSSSGIGLTLVKKIVERNGGAIRVESEKGEGTTFYFTVPDRALHSPASHTLTILLVDANEDYARHTTKLLTHLGHRVRHVNAWPDAEALLKQSNTRPDLVLIDYTQSATPPKALIREIYLRLPHVHVIACIPDVGPERIPDGLKISGTLTKPFTLEKMNDILHTTAVELR